MEIYNTYGGPYFKLTDKEVYDFAKDQFNREYRGLIWKPEIEHIFVDIENSVIVVAWDSGRKTKVKLKDGDAWDLEAGVNAAIVKEIYASSHSSYQKLISTHTTYVQHKKPKKKTKNG